uniref:Uncharacterized protein n=1 Tax=Aegilops tauschii subsp. strangulata TaxID=200361 RepID=A0A453PTR9_AEGTS
MNVCLAPKEKESQTCIHLFIPPQGHCSKYHISQGPPRKTPPTGNARFANLPRAIRPRGPSLTRGPHRAPRSPGGQPSRGRRVYRGLASPHLPTHTCSPPSLKTAHLFINSGDPPPTGDD